MASKTIDIVVSVKNAASGALKNITKELQETGAAARSASKGFTSINSNSKKMSNNFLSLGQKAGIAKKDVVKLTIALRPLEKESKKIATNFKGITDSLNNAFMGLSKLVNRLDKQLTRLIKKVNKLKRAVSSAAKDINKMSNKLNSINKASNSAGRGMEKVSRAVKKGKENIKKANKNFLEFNRTLFTTTAFTGMFFYAFSRLKDNLLQAARFDRIKEQFSKTFGSKGSLIKEIRKTTDNSIDVMETMRAGIALKSLGIITSTTKLASFVAKAGTAAKRAGLTSAEGIKKFTAFMKTGSIQNLEFLNLLARTNTGFKLTQAVLAKYGGVAGSALTSSQRLAIGLELVNKATKGLLKGQRDAADIFEDAIQFTSLFSKEVSMLGVKAFSPLIEKFTKIIMSMTDFVERIRKTDKEIMFLIKSIATATITVTGLFAAFGTLKLITVALGSIGTGIPVLVATMTALAGIFFTTSKGVDGLKSTLNTFGSVIRGVWQLFSSFFKPGNFEKGIGEIDETLAKSLNEKGLLSFVKTMARVMIVTKQFAKGFAKGFRDGFDYVLDKLSAIKEAVLGLFGIESKPWERKWIEGTENIGKVVGKLTIGLVGAFAVFKGLGFIKGALSKIPVVGRLFGGGTGKGTKDNPMWVVVKKGLGISSTTVSSSLMEKVGAGAGSFSLAKYLPTLKNLGTLGGFTKLTGTALLAYFGFDAVKGVTLSLIENFDSLKLAGQNLTTSFSILIESGLNSLIKWIDSIVPKEFTDLFDPSKPLPENANQMQKEIKTVASYTKTGIEIIENLEVVTKAMTDGIIDLFSSKMANFNNDAVSSNISSSLSKGKTPNISKISTNEEQKITQLRQVQSELSGEKQERFKEAFKNAQSDLSKGGKTVTPEELTRIMRYTLQEATAPMIKEQKTTNDNTKPRNSDSKVRRR